MQVGGRFGTLIECSVIVIYQKYKINLLCFLITFNCDNFPSTPVVYWTFSIDMMGIPFVEHVFHDYSSSMKFYPCSLL